MTARTRTGTGPHDLDLGGVVGIRLLDATAADVAKVVRQLGPLHATLGRDPDLTVRFVDRVPSGPLTQVGLGTSGYDSSHFFVVDGRGTRAKTLLPLEDAGARMEIVCERAVPSVPHLVALVNLTAVAKGVLPLHASAFTAGSLGVVVTGWAKGGKTEALLGAVGAGARYVGDEWVYLTGEGHMFGLPEPIRLWAWHLEQAPRMLGSRPAGERARLAAVRRAAAAAEAAVKVRTGSRTLPKVAAALARQAYLQVPPAELFGAERLLASAAVDVVVLVMSGTEHGLRVEEPAPGEVAARMAASLVHERNPFLETYREFRFAFPGRHSPLVEQLQQREAELLARTVDGRPSVKVIHPYPCDIVELARTVTRAATRTAAAADKVGEAAS